MKPGTNSGTGVPPVRFKKACFQKQLILGIFVMLAALSSMAQHSPKAQADSANFTINTTASSENGTQVSTDTAVFILNTTGAVAAQSDSVDFVINTLFGSVAPFRLANPVALAGGGFRFSFTNSAGATFRVFAATNLSIAFSNWLYLGNVTDQPPGQYQFNDPQITNYSRRYYRVISP